MRSELDNIMSSEDFLSDNHFRPVAYITMNLLPRKSLTLQVEIRRHIWTYLHHLRQPLCILLWSLSRSSKAMVWRTQVALNPLNLSHYSTVERPKFQQYFRFARTQKHWGYNCIPGTRHLSSRRCASWEQSTTSVKLDYSMDAL